MSLRKCFLLFSCLIALFLITTGCGSSDSDTEKGSSTKENDGETITLKVTSHAPDNAGTVQQIKVFMEEVTQITDGQVQFELYPGAQLGEGPDSIDMVKNGVTDLAHVISNFHPNEMKLGAAFGSPLGLYDDPVKGSIAFNNTAKQSPMLEADFLNHNVRPVFMFYTSANGIFTDGKEIKVPEDMKGMKTRTTGGHILNALNFIGATPTQLTSNEVYNAFNNGVINGVVTHATGAMDWGWEEIMKYAVDGINFGTSPSGLIINEDVYQNLPENVQEAIMQAGEEAAKYAPKAIDDHNKEAYKEMEDLGITVHKLTEDEKEQWQKVYHDFTDSVIEEMNNKDFEEALEIYKKELEELED